MIFSDERTVDEKDAVTLVSILARAIGKWDADERIKKRGKRADDWLCRYYERHPEMVLREEAVLSTQEE